MQWLLAALAFYLATKNRGNEPIQWYWTLVTVYWIMNRLNRRKA